MALINLVPLATGAAPMPTAHSTVISDWHLQLLLGVAIGIIGAVITIGILMKSGVLAFRGKPDECNPCIISPSQCPEHKAEQERSIRNQGAIENLWKEFGLLRGKIEAGLTSLKADQTYILLGLVQAGVIKPQPPPSPPSL